MILKLPHRNLTIAELMEHRMLYVGVACRRCGHHAFLELAHLRDRLGGKVRESQLRRALVCNQCGRRDFLAKPLSYDKLPRHMQVAISLDRKERHERPPETRELKSE